MALDEGHSGAAGDGPAGCRAIDFTRIRGMDPASDRILGRELHEAKAAQGRVVPFFLHLPDEAARAAFRDLPPLEGHCGNGAMVLGGERAARLTDGAFLAVLAPVDWFARLAVAAPRDAAIVAFRDAEKTIRLSEPGLLPGWLCRVARRLPAALSWGEPAGEPKPKAGHVCIGVIDDGIAIAHERFRAADGSSRVRAYWDQNGLDVSDAHVETARPFEATELGKHVPGPVIEKTEIDSALRWAEPHMDEEAVYRRLGLIDFRSARPRFVAHRLAHGTHVLDLAAGYGAGAPEAALRPIIAVQIANPVISRPIDDLRLDFHIWLGILFIVDRADRIWGENAMPLVINASIGKIAGPHDGSSLLEAAIDALVARREGKTHVVLPSGNQHLSQCHACAALDERESEAFDWIVQPDDRTNSTVQIWLPEGESSDRVVVELRIPSGETFALAGKLAGSAPPPLALRHHGRVVGEISRESTITGRTVIRIDIGPTVPDPLERSDFDVAPSGAWRLSLRRTGGPLAAPLHVWSQRDDTLHGYPQAGRQSYFEHERFRAVAERLHAGSPYGGRDLIEDDAHPDQVGATPVRRSFLLNAIASGKQVLVAGGHVRQTGEAAPYSAGGPAESDRCAGPGRACPDVLLPSEDSRVQRGILAAGTRSGSVVAMGGSSVAAPQLTRIAARCLAEHGAKPPELLRKAIAEAAVRPECAHATAPERCGAGNLAGVRRGRPRHRDGPG